MSHAHYEAVRVTSERPYTTYTTTNSTRCFLPIRMRRPTTTGVDRKVSYRFAQPDQTMVKQMTHEHVLIIGDQLMTQLKRNNENRNKQIQQRFMETERVRLENEFLGKTEEMKQKFKGQLEEEKVRFVKEYEKVIEQSERANQKKNREEEQHLIKRMKSECDQALARQLKLLTEQTSQTVKQAEDRLRQLLELKYLEEKEQFTEKLTAKKDAEYVERESKAIERVKADMRKEYDQQIQRMNEQHKQEIEDLTNKLKLTEERFRREFSLRARLESDFRLLQADYKRFMDSSNVFHSDYMLKLCYIGEQIGDTKFEEVLDRILAETNVESKLNEKNIYKKKQSFKLT